MKWTVTFAISIGLISCAVAMPSRSDLKKVQPTVNELMAEDIAAMKGGKQSSEGAAKKAEELAGLATDEASKFLLLKGAFGLYVEGGKYDEALAVLEALKAQVKDVPDKVLADIVRAKMKKVSKKDGGAILSYYAQLDRRMRFAAEKARLEKAVKDRPSDKDAHRRLALATAVLDGWKASLADFALAGGDFAVAAKAEQDGKVAAAADAWWACAAVSGDEDAQEEIKAHAVSLYAQVIRDGKLDGLKLALAKKRVAESGEVAPSASPVPVAVAAEPVRSEGQKVVAKAMVAAPPAKVRAQGRPMSLDLGKGVRMDFVNCPAGDMSVASEVNSSTPFKYTITRPFWFGRVPVTRRQITAVYGKVPLRIDNYERMRQQGPFVGDPKQAVDRLMKLHGGEDSVWYGGVEAIRCVCQDLTAKFKRQLPRGYVIRQPSVAEWLYAYFAGEEGALERIRPTKENALHLEHSDWLGAGEWLLANGLQMKDRNEWQWAGRNIALAGGKPGQMAPNAWQIHDLNMFSESVLDLFDFKNIPNASFDQYKFVLNLWDCTFGDENVVRLAGRKDPLFCSQKSFQELGLAKIGRGDGLARDCRLIARLGGSPHISHMRLVIGPDLEKERGTDHSSDPQMKLLAARMRER